jgi:CubicO group peptidase (beta-lactamase class C family)
MSESMAGAALAAALEHGEVGVQVAVYQRGQRVLNACLGQDGRGRHVDTRTLFPVFSVTKAVTSLAIHILADRSEVDLEAPIATYWPEFGQSGKGQITIRHVLSHESGIPQMPDGVTPERMADWTWMIRAIEQYEPAFAPGTHGGYQSLVFGWLIGEVVQRVDPLQRRFSQFVREEICGPLGIDDLWIGLPGDLRDRAAVLSGSGRDPVDDPTPLYLRTIPSAVEPGPEVHNLDLVRRACLPGAGGIMSADAAARVFALLASRGEFGETRLLRPETVESMLTPRRRSGEFDLTSYGGGRVKPEIGIGGLWLSHGLLGGGSGVLCHSGAGGSVGWADLESGVAAVITHNRMFSFNVTQGEVFDHPFRGLRDLIWSFAGRN